MYLGIDLGGINVAAGLVNESGRVVAHRSVPTPRTPEGVADAIAEHVKSLLAETAEPVVETIKSSQRPDFLLKKALMYDRYGIRVREV